MHPEPRSDPGVAEHPSGEHIRAARRVGRALLSAMGACPTPVFITRIQQLTTMSRTLAAPDRGRRVADGVLDGRSAPEVLVLPLAAGLEQAPGRRGLVLVQGGRAHRGVPRPTRRKSLLRARFNQ